MSVSVGSIKIDTSKLDKMTAEARPKARKIVSTYGKQITQSATMRIHRITGNLIGTITSESKMIDDLTYRVQDGTEYGLRVELGFVGKDSLGRIYNQAARPFLSPAIEEYRQRFLDAFKELFK